MRRPDLRDRVYVFVHTYIRANGYAPTQCEIACAVGVSQGNVWRYLTDLEAQGRIERTPQYVRNIRLSA